jgi:hypothetical protein
VYINKLDKGARVEINIPYNGVPQSELTRVSGHVSSPYSSLSMMLSRPDST